MHREGEGIEGSKEEGGGAGESMSEDEEQKKRPFCANISRVDMRVVRILFWVALLTLLSLLWFGTREITELTEGTVEKREEKGGIVSQLDLHSNNCSKGVISMVKTSPHFSSNV